jgi:Icc-related predicted phosphoesterase
LNVCVSYKSIENSGNKSNDQLGSEELSEQVAKVSPQLHLFGHNHCEHFHLYECTEGFEDGYGVSKVGSTIFMNAANCIGNHHSTERRNAIYFELKPDCKINYEAKVTCSTVKMKGKCYESPDSQTN